MSEVDRTVDRLWKIREFFEILRTNFSKFYNPSEYLAVDKVIVKFKGRAVFTQYIPKIRKRFDIKTFKLFDSAGYTYDSNVYFSNDKRATQHLTATHSAVSNLIMG